MFMNIIPITTKVDTADQAAQDAQFYRGVLHGMIETGIEMIRQIKRQAEIQAAAAKTDPHAPSGTDFSIAYERVSESIHECIVLAQELAEPAPARVSGA